MLKSILGTISRMYGGVTLFLTINETLKWLSSLPILMQESVDVIKHHAYTYVVGVRSEHRGVTVNTNLPLM